MCGCFHNMSIYIYAHSSMAIQTIYYMLFIFLKRAYVFLTLHVIFPYISR